MFARRLLMVALALGVSGERAFADTAKPKWRIVEPRQGADTLVDDGDGRLFAFRALGGTLVSTDRGETWKPETIPATRLSRATVGPDGVVAVGEDGKLAFESKGVWTVEQIPGKWTATELPNRPAPVVAWRTPKGALCAVNWNGTLFRRAVGETTWRETKVEALAGVVNAFVSGDQIVAIAPDAVVLSMNGGDTWDRKHVSAPGPLIAAWSSGKDVYAVGHRGSIAHSPDGGATWTLEKSGTKARLMAVMGASALIYTAGEKSAVLVSRKAGRWSPEKAPAITWKALWVYDDGRVVVAGVPSIAVRASTVVK